MQDAPLLSRVHVSNRAGKERAERWVRAVAGVRSVNAMLESFGSSAQNELLDCKRWTTRIRLLNAVFDYIKVFYNRRRRHSQRG
jgi:transposase InsO family protein